MSEIIITLLNMLVKPSKNKRKTLQERAIIWLDLAVFLTLIFGALYFYTHHIKPPQPIIINVQK